MGLVESMARPGGNVTGFTPFEPSLGGKWVELLKEIVPTVTGAAILVNPETAPNASSFLQFAEAAGSTLGIFRSRRWSVLRLTLRFHCGA